jgi:hypothetical protein
MTPHVFIFTPSRWEGKGEIGFSVADDKLPFSMRWQVFEKENGLIRLSQIVDVQSFNEPLHNKFLISDITDSSFAIELENELVGKVKGKGVFDTKTLAWEFRARSEGFEGFEVYELQEDATYKMRAEFLGGEGFRTIISSTLVKV